jgi:lysophospholipase L1-like esterase
MIDCLILGDSIGVGLQSFRKECAAYVQGGINSHVWNRDYLHHNLTAKTTIISLGSNDTHAVRTILELQTMREKVKADRVFWILPAIKPDVQKMVQTVAEANNDVVLEIVGLSPDKVHPNIAGYKDLATRTK